MKRNISKKISYDIYKYFSTLEGNQHIASEYALFSIIELVKKYKFINILEVGIGIGSIAYSVLKFNRISGYNIKYTGTEDNDFCINALPNSLAELYSGVNLIRSIDDISDSVQFDFVIIDGGISSLSIIKKIISENGVIFIEGDRSSQLKSLLISFPKMKKYRVVSCYKNPEYGPFSFNNWVGGGSVIFINPNKKQIFQYCIGKYKEHLGYLYRRLKE